MEVCQHLAAPHCDSTHSYGFRSLITCTVSLISRPRWTESRRMTRTVTTNSMVSCEINLQFINWFISSKDGFIDNEPLDPAPLPYTLWRALDRDVPDAIDNLLTGIYQWSQSHASRRMSIEDEDIHEWSRILTAKDFPIWRVGCRVRSSYILIEKLFIILFRWGLRKRQSFHCYKG